MVRALVAFVVVIGGCTTDTAEESQPVERVAQRPVVAQPAQVVAQPPDRVAACRKVCWDDIPVDACKAQRDRCFKRATKRDDKSPDTATPDKLSADKLHCREMALECRKIRHDCLAACETPAAAK